MQKQTLLKDNTIIEKASALHCDRRLNVLKARLYLQRTALACENTSLLEKRGLELRIPMKGVADPKWPTMEVSSWIQPPRYRETTPAVVQEGQLHLKPAATELGSIVYTVH